MVCFSVPEVVEAVAQISAPVLVTPLKDVLVSEGHPAQLRCSVSGEGTAHLLLAYEQTVLFHLRNDSGCLRKSSSDHSDFNKHVVFRSAGGLVL